MESRRLCGWHAGTKAAPLSAVTAALASLSGVIVHTRLSPAFRTGGTREPLLSEIILMAGDRAETWAAAYVQLLRRKSSACDKSNPVGSKYNSIAQGNKTGKIGLTSQFHTARTTLSDEPAFRTN